VILAASATLLTVICVPRICGSALPSNSGTLAFESKVSAKDLSFAAVPEPGALVSLIGGAAILLGIQRFRRRA
jgi:hypothetical protein